MPVKRNADQEPPDLVSRRMHGNAYPVTGLHTADSNGLHLHLWRVGRMPVNRNAAQGPSVVISGGLYRNAGPDSVLHLCAAGHGLHLVHVLGLGILPVQ